MVRFGEEVGVDEAEVGERVLDFLSDPLKWRTLEWRSAHHKEMTEFLKRLHAKGNNEGALQVTTTEPGLTLMGALEMVALVCSNLMCLMCGLGGCWAHPCASLINR